MSLAGLQVLDALSEKTIELVTRYGLLCNLGWAYFGQKKYKLARETLEAAVDLEGELKKRSGEFRRVLPHYYLGHLYELQSPPKDAKERWEAALRLLKEDNWADREWLTVVKEKLKTP